MNDALDLVWRRAELRNPCLGATEISAWPPEQRDSIINLGLIRRISDAQALTCEDCGTPHLVEILRDPGKPQHPYYFCPEIGRVAVPAEELRRWEIDFDQLATHLRRAVGLTAKAAAVIPSRIWLLGRKESGNGYWELFLMRGLWWTDAAKVLNDCVRLQQSPAPVVVVPHRFPSIGNPAPAWPVRALSEVVSLANSDLVIDTASLAIAVGSVETYVPSRSPRQRMSRSLGTEHSVQAVARYLQHTHMTDTEFGVQCGTTDKTVRNFRRLGKVRRSTFELMAKSMELTSEQLLRGEWPPSLKRSIP